METETFQHYRILRRDDGTLWELGRGAMAVTYKAFDVNLCCPVALKVVNSLSLEDEHTRARFVREARAAAALRHRNIASVYHLGNDDETYFYAMEFVDGETVADLVNRRGPLPPAEALGIAAQVARALRAAAKQGLVHRDIKPTNLMVVHEDDEDSLAVKVIDFGLARRAAADPSAQITLSGFVGTPQYASPEQVAERDLDSRSDIYSLGVTLWYMLTGAPTFNGPAASIGAQHLNSEPPWASVAHLPASVRALLARMLQKNPDDRPQDPSALRREIDSCLENLEAGTPAPAPPAAAVDTPTIAIESGLANSNDATLPPPVKLPKGSDLADSNDATLPPPTAPVMQSGLVDSNDATLPPPPRSTWTTGLADSNSETLPPPTHSSEDETVAPSAPVVAPQGPPPAAGEVFAGRYTLLEFAGEGRAGRVFRTQDALTGGRVAALKILRPESPLSLTEINALKADLRQLRAALHPHLIEVFALNQARGYRYVASEWVNGFTLVDLMRQRGRLELREALHLLEQASDAAAHGSANGLHRLELAPHQILVHFPAAFDGDKARVVRSILGRPLARWPAFGLKIDALAVPAHETADAPVLDGSMTMVPSARAPGRGRTPGVSSLSAGYYFHALGALLYEMLSGAPVPSGHEGRDEVPPLPTLSEEANDLLQRALSPAPGFRDEREFFNALVAASGLARADLRFKGEAGEKPDDSWAADATVVPPSNVDLSNSASTLPPPRPTGLAMAPPIRTKPLRARTAAPPQRPTPQVGGAPSSMRPLVIAAVAGIAVAALVIALVLWSQHLPPFSR